MNSNFLKFLINFQDQSEPVWIFPGFDSTRQNTCLEEPETCSRKDNVNMYFLDKAHHGPVLRSTN